MEESPQEIQTATCRGRDIPRVFQRFRVRLKRSHHWNRARRRKACIEVRRFTIRRLKEKTP